MGSKKTDRYVVSLEEAYEPGSNDQVLKNFIGIKEKEVMEQIEARELLRAEQEIFALYDADHRFTAQDICDMHECWLGNVYPFAGKYRTVNMSKDGFPFAGAPYIRNCMEKFEQSYLAKQTPCKTISLDELAYALGVVHIEFIVIHPY
ncbi:MAG: Fic/DOC family protein [Gammaproteobacteria bacterium]